MNSNFLEPRNITSLINIVRSNVKQEINYDIANDQKYINVLKKLVKTIHEANINNDVSTDYMNNLVVTKCVPFLVNQVKKKNLDNNIPAHLPTKTGLYGDLPLNTNDRPVTTRMRDTSQDKSRANNSNSDTLTDFSSLTLGGYDNFNQEQGQMIQRGHNTGMDSNLNLEPPPRQMPNLNFNSKSNSQSNSQSNTLGNAMNMEMNSPPQNFMRQNVQMNIQDNSMESQFRNPPLVNANMNNNLNEQNFIQNQAGINTQDLDESNEDLAARLEAAQKERGLDIAGPQLPNQPRQNLPGSMNDTIVNNSLQERERKIETNNSEFFRKLESNNENTQTKERDQQLSMMNTGNYMSNDSGNLELGESVYDAYTSNNITTSMIQLGSQNSMNASDQILNFKENLNDKTNVINSNNNDNNLEQQGLGIDSDVRERVRKIESETKKDATKEYMDNTFLSTNYQFTQRKRKVLCLDISDNLENITTETDGSSGKKAIDNLSNSYWGRFRLNLAEDLIVDKLSDVFIESIIINNPAQANPFTNLYFVMDIEEFNIKTQSNNNNFNDKFVLPNENTESSGSTKIMKYHLKSNYVATVNPMKISSLTFNITNESGDSVENTYTTYDVSAEDSYKVGTSGASDINVSNMAVDTFRVLDAVYNSSFQFLGNINKTTTENGNIQFMAATKFHIHNGETLFYPSGYTTNFLALAASSGSTSISVEINPSDDFSVGDKVYLGNGIVLGKIASMDDGADPETITFEKAITQFVPAGARLYKNSPLPRVFASNEKSNRIILELVIMPR